MHNKNCNTLRDVQSIRRKFNKMVKEKTPTGDPTIPPQVLQAKHIQDAIVSRADAASEADDDDLGFPTESHPFADDTNEPTTVSNSAASIRPTVPSYASQVVSQIPTAPRPTVARGRRGAVVPTTAPPSVVDHA